MVLVLEHRIVAPEACSFNHDAVEDSTDGGDESALVACEGENDHREGVVMDMNFVTEP